MGLDVVYKVGDKEFVVVLPMEELDELGELNPDISSYLDAIFDVDDFGVFVERSKKKLIENIDKTLPLIEELGKSCYHYSISFTAPFDTFFDKVTNFSGLKINGEIFSFESGRNKCELIKIMKDGHRDDSSIDIREWKTIEENSELGTIKINKRKTSFKLKNKLKKLKAFLESAKDEKVLLMMG
jgi:hypothetical protein